MTLVVHIDHDPDLVLRVEVLKQLQASTSLRTTDCDIKAGRVVLRGRVASFESKRSASKLVRNLPGVREVCNCLSVGAVLAVQPENG